MRKLLDFDVVIEPHDDGYCTRVVSSPAGEAQADFALPFTDKDLRILILEVVGSISRLRRKVRRIESPDRQVLENFGGQLFEAVFSGPVGECLGRSRMTAESKDAGLRIRLRLPGALANVPWEYLYDAEHGFLGLDPETALVRYVELPARARPFSINPPLRILAMISAPSDVPGLEGEEEWNKLNDTLGDLRRRGMVQVDRLKGGTLAAIQRPLRLGEYHVLHFIGHGGYDENAQDGALALEGSGRETRLVTGRDLGMMIRDHRSLRLVVLNACEGARSAQDDPFGGVAQALVRQGIPAVIAMQFEISDPAALVFSQSFYQAIADGLPVDVATVEARRAMFAEGNEVEWATPVLYLRSPDGRVFTRSRISQAERRAQEEAEAQAREQAEAQAREQAEAQAREQAERQARVPLPVAGPIALCVPLLTLALSYSGYLGNHQPRNWWLVVLCIAPIGFVAAMVEHRRRRVPAWTVTLEFFFAWFLAYAIVRLTLNNIEQVFRNTSYLPHRPHPLAALAVVAAIFSAVMCTRVLVGYARKRRRTVHPLLPAFLGCMAVGLVAGSIGYARGIDTFSQIGAVFLFAALLMNLLAPLLVLVRPRAPATAQRRHDR